MEISLQAWINQLIENRRARNKKVIMLSAISFVLVFTVLSAIIIPAITLNGEPTCGLEEHVHTDECYELVLVCDKEEYLGEEESKTPEESESVLETQTSQNEEEVLKTKEPALICGLEESEGHTHTQDCYKTELVLTCELEEGQDHTHDEDCYEERIVTEKVLICELEEDQDHTHTDDCYEDVPVLACELEESEGHSHTEDCYAPEEESSLEDIEKLEANQEETSEPEATEAEEEEETEKAQEREIHVHTDECYELRLVCDKEEHTHTKDCYKHETYTEDLIRIYEDEEIKLQVTLKDGYQIPSEAELKVVPITEESDSEKYNELFDRVDQEALGEDQAIKDIRFYDIGFELDGENLEPNHGSVRLSLEFKEPLFDAEEIKTADAIKVLHFEDDGDLEDLTDIIKNTPEGVAAVEFSTESFSSFSIVLPGTTQTGDFYKLIDARSENLSSSERYLIVSANGNMALSSSQTGYRRAVTLSQVEGNPDYFEVFVGSNNAAAYNDLNWQFVSGVTGTTGTTRIQTATNARLNLNRTTIISSTATTSHTVSRGTLSATWRISYSTYYSTYYLYNTGGNFSRSTTSDTTQHNANLLILQRVNTTLTIPGNVVYDDGTGSHLDCGVKPPYDSYINESGAQSDNFSTTDRSFSAVSDPSTSKIEAKFDGTADDDGKVLTDKSVIYGHDDYNAFTTYDDGVFSVSMSALGQEYNLPLEEHLISPIDVAIVLDVSGSMQYVHESATRAKHAVDALNDTITYIMTLHPANRVGLVLFSSGSTDFLPLGRFYVGTQYADINYNNNYQYLTYSGTIPSNMVMSTASSLRFADTRGLVPAKTFNASSGQGGWIGTYTQLGIQRGANLLLDNNDTIYEIPNSGGETVNRIPVMLFVTDGEPTHSTNNYANPLAGPHYGSGVASVDNAKGIHGYNVVLTAMHFKKQIALHYEEVAKWYPIGLGIFPTGTGTSETSSASGDHYKRALLDPTPERVAYLLDNGGKNRTTTSLQLHQLLTGSFASTTVTVDSNASIYGSYPMPDIGVTNTTIPVAQHGFPHYRFANESFFGEFNAIDLADILKGVIDRSRTVYNYKFDLKEILTMEHVHMTDPIGYGMELKDDPVLRHNGVNYTHTSTSTVTVDGVTTTTYHYDYQTTDPTSDMPYDLNNIGVDVITDANGNQTVEMHVISSELPVYHPDCSFSFYYEALPVRLIYQVGLTAQTMANARKGDTFFTNRWEDGEGAKAQLRPTDNNPFYDPDNYDNINYNTEKSNNPSGTEEDSFTGVCDGDTNEHYWGNNGKITITNAPDTTGISVNKVWRANDGTEISDEEVLENLPDITVHLYQNTQAGGGGDLIDTATFGHADGWTYAWTGLDYEDEDENPYYYSVLEDAVNGYYTSYINNEGINGGDITIENRIGGMVLPETGGKGPLGQMQTGFLLMLISTVALGLPMIYKKRRILFERRFERPPDG